VAPHSTWVAALWAVLTRLLRSDVAHYDEPALGKLAAGLTPMDKALLYAEGTIPRRLNSEESKLLRAGLLSVSQEFDPLPIYEGMTGASPREVRTLLLDAAQHPDHACLSPLGVLDQIHALVEKGDYQFLKHKPESGFHDHRSFLSQVRDHWLTKVDIEVRTSTGLVDESRYEELFERYIMQVSLWIKGERYRDPLTGRYEEPDENLFRSIEDILDVKDPKEFRRNLISVVAAYSIDHPGAKLDPQQIFPRYLDRVKEAYYTERRGLVAGTLRDMLNLLADASTQQVLEEDKRVAAEAALARVLNDYGYCRSCARTCLGELLKARYADA
jgi:predicted Ser/Thr protein kinase